VQQGETYDFDTRVKSDMKIKAVWKDHPDYYEFMPVDIQCYDKHAYDKGKFVSVDNPSLGDKIVCFIGFETMGYDEVEEFSFDLVYNDSLYFNEVINSLDLYKIDDERYTYVYDDPMSVNEAGGYVFDVVDDGEIFIELENVEMLIDGEIFITEENPEFFAEVKPIDEDAGPIYVQYRGDSFYLQCYDKESVEKNDYEYKDEVSKGDMLVCFVGYETNVDDKVKSVEYDLNLGAGLKLVEEDLYGIGEKSTDNHYLFEFNPTSVNDIGEYVIQITDDRRVDQLYMELSDIKFVTSDDDHYSNKDARIDFILEN
jgi:hypothetical protein